MLVPAGRGWYDDRAELVLPLRRARVLLERLAYLARVRLAVEGRELQLAPQGVVLGK